ncbi:MAG: transcription-repair coupling factor, partial [Candidatus Thiodiazotropha sp.]
PLSPFEPVLPQAVGERLQWGGLHGSSAALAIANAASAYQGLLLVVTHDMQSATRLERELGFFLDTADDPVVNFPDWETLPYDLFSPLPELISQRLLTLYRLPRMQRGVLVAPVSTLMQRLAPKSFLDAHCLIVECGQSIDLDETRRRLEHGGYQCVSQVFSHGEFAVRGSLLDIFPMGSQRPYRIDLFDDEVDTIRTFDPESQRSCDKVPRIEMLPAREFPMDEAGINRFRRNYRSQFEGDLQQSLIYQDVSDGRMPGGLEYYLPLFFEQTETLFDYLPEHHMVMELVEVRERATIFFNEVKVRFEERRHDLERPLLAPSKLYISADELASFLKQGHSVLLSYHKVAARSKGYTDVVNFNSKLPPPVAFQVRSKDPASALRHFLENGSTRVLFIAEGAGRREMLLGTLRDLHIDPKVVDGWEPFLNENIKTALCVAPLEQGLWLQEQGIALITETQLYGERVRQERRRRKVSQDPDQIV